MWSKIYLGVLVLGILVIGFFTYYSWSWLQSIGAPADALAGFQYNAGITWTAMWIFSLVLLLIGNAVLWQSGKSWAMWIMLLFFAVCVVGKTVVLDSNYAKLALFAAGSTSPNVQSGIGSVSILSFVIDAGMIIAGSAIVFFDHFLVSRLRAKTYPEQIAPTEAAPE
jgi:hypothetical protein